MWTVSPAGAGRARARASRGRAISFIVKAIEDCYASRKRRGRFAAERGGSHGGEQESRARKWRRRGRTGAVAAAIRGGFAGGRIGDGEPGVGERRAGADR